MLQHLGFVFVNSVVFLVSVQTSLISPVPSSIDSLQSHLACICVINRGAKTSFHIGLDMTRLQHQLQCLTQPWYCSSLDLSEMAMSWWSFDWYLSFTLSVISQANHDIDHARWPIATQALVVWWWHISDYGAFSHKWSCSEVELVVLRLTHCYSICLTFWTSTLSFLFVHQGISLTMVFYASICFVTPRCFCPSFD